MRRRREAARVRAPRVRRGALRRALGAAGSGMLVVLVAAPPAAAGTVARLEIVADGGARAFAVRPSYDSGGASPFHLYVGYTEANVTTPDPQADGQASWYNFGIAETAAFKEPAQCTPQENERRVREQTIPDIQSYIDKDLIPAVLAGRVPVAPGPALPCSERLPGFAQSRHPATVRKDGTGIPASSRDDFLTKPLCRDPGGGACAAWTALFGATGSLARDGQFESTATGEPSASSQAVLFGAGDGVVVSVGFTQVRSSARLEGGRLVAEATARLHDICIGRDAATGACAVRIDELRQFAVASRDTAGAVTRDADTVLVGVSGTEVAVGKTDVGPIKLSRDSAITYGEEDSPYQFRVQLVSRTGGCDPKTPPDAKTVIADAGGIRIFGKGGQGGGITIGGACARARIEALSIEPLPAEPLAPVAGPPSVVPLPPLAPVIEPPREVPPVLSPPRVVQREIVRYVARRAPALRTAPYWASALAALLLLGGVGFAFRSSRPVAPVARSIDRFARQFLRG